MLHSGPRRFVLLLLVHLASAPAGAFAADGDLDAGFHSDSDGVFHFHAGSSGDTRTLRVLAAPDGALVMLVRTGGNLDAWRRVTATGASSTCLIGSGLFSELSAADATFDRLGRLVVVGGQAGEQLVVSRFLYPACTLDAAFDGNGVAGYFEGAWTYPGGIVERARAPGAPIAFPFLYVAFWIDDAAGRDVVLMRLADDGAVDTTWGGGDGWVRVTVPGPEGPPRVVALALDTRQRLVVGLDLEDYDASCVNLGCNDFGVLRFEANGALDDSFDGNGIKRVPIDILADGRDILTDLAIAPDGHIALVGEVEGSAGFHLGVAVLRDNGAPETGFDTNGVRLLDAPDTNASYGGAAVYQTDGKLVVAGSAREVATAPYLFDSFAARLLSTGALDTSFGDGGMTVVPVDLYPGANDRAMALALDAGRPVVGGYAVRPGLDEAAFLFRLENSLIFMDGFETGDTFAW